MGGIDPTVSGALIASGATVIGFIASTITMRASDRSTRDVAREVRIWERKSALYESLFGLLSRFRGTPSMADATEIIGQELAGHEIERTLSRAEVTDLADRLASHELAIELYASQTVRDRLWALIIICGVAARAGQDQDGSPVAGPSVVRSAITELQSALRKDIQAPHSRR